MSVEHEQASDWRYTGVWGRIFGFDARALVPIVPTIFYARPWTLLICLVTILFLSSCYLFRVRPEILLSGLFTRLMLCWRSTSSVWRRKT